MIEMRGISVTFNRGAPTETPALRGIDLTIADGEFVTVIGSNGAGKSTVLNALAGDVPIDAGRVIIEGQDITTWPAPARTQLVARVFQDPLAGSCGELTIEENLSLAASRGRMRGFSLALNTRRRTAFQASLRQLGLGLEHRLRARMDLLSGGQRQAVALLMATLSPMKILLLDEHTAALDPKTAEFVLGLTRRIVEQRGLTTLMVTHSMRHALDYGQRTLMLHEGRVVLDVSGDTRRGLDVPDLLALFAKHRKAVLADDNLLLG